MIVLVGFMGSGKSTVGRLLAVRLGVPFLDSDEALEARQGRSIAQVFAADGEAAFRRLERETIASLLSGPESVLAVGGGAVQDESTRSVLVSHTVVYLAAPLETLRERLGDDASRPMLRRAGVDELYARRLPLYEEVADVVVESSGSPGQVAERVLRAISP